MSYLLEEFFDEWGLYVVHHHRWTDVENREVWNSQTSKKRPELGPGGLIAYHENQDVWMPGHLRSQIAQWFNNRQTNRLPYFLSASGNERGGLFLPTRDLLDQSFERMLCALELIFAQENSVLAAFGIQGEEMSAADLSLFGQFNMLAHFDRGSRRIMNEKAPSFVRWLDAAQSKVQKHTNQVPLGLTIIPSGEPPKTHSSIPGDALKGLKLLMQEISDVFVPLQQANKLAFERYRELGESEFNESAMEKQRALFKSEILGTQYVMVAKSFQYKVWIEIEDQWSSLSESDKDAIAQLGFKIDCTVPLELLSLPAKQLRSPL